ncbi:hypothetical protein CCP4SC76_4010003 [Gammaproteobacteria bacterium]
MSRLSSNAYADGDSLAREILGCTFREGQPIDDVASHYARILADVSADHGSERGAAEFGILHLSVDTL